MDCGLEFTHPESQIIEQSGMTQSENLAFCLDGLIALSIESEHLRHKTKRKDSQKVNSSEMESPSAVATMFVKLLQCL
jgi:hypothetical protein